MSSQTISIITTALLPVLVLLYVIYKKDSEKPEPVRQLVIAPILAHGIYDSIIFITEITPELSAILTIVFMIFCIRMWRFASSRIKEHIKRDQSDIFKVNNFE